MDKSAADTPTPETETVEARLARTEKSVESISKKLDQLDQREKENTKNDQSRNKGASKATLALGFGLLGWKLFGGIFAKAGFIFGDNVRAFKAGGKAAVWDQWKTFYTMGMGKGEFNLFEEYKYTVRGGIIGSIVGPVIGGTVGWMRGDRIDKPSDILAKPLDSFHRLAISERQFAKEYPTHPRAIADKKSWGEAVEESREQAQANAASFSK